MAFSGAGIGPNLETIQTETLGFLSIAGDAQVQLTSPWTTPPTNTASLLSIAPRKGLVAAAGPDALYLATTDSVRTAFGSKSGDRVNRPFEPQAKVPLPMRISRLAFTADEQYIILSAEQGGGLAIYEVQTLSQGSSQSAFELSTSGESLRALIPNPMAEMANLCAVVTDNGNLLMANLNDRSLVNGANGLVLRAQVTCAAWSTKGKQLVAGMADGTIVQMTPDGTEKAQIPKPSNLGDCHVSSISWLENNVFLVIHTKTSGESVSFYHIITRHPASGGQAPSFEFRKLSDPVEPYSYEKPAHHTVLRLRDYAPNLQDLLVVTSSAVDSIGLLTRSKEPLASDKPAEAITSVFTTTEFADDSNRAQIPMGENYTDTFPIGVSLDLSSKEKVYRPITRDEEIEYSSGPLPALWALSNEGVLSCWWIVYADAIRKNLTYSGMVTSEGASAPQTSAPASTFGAPAAPAPAFGGSSALGAKTSPWGGPSAITSGQSAAAPVPTFGSSTFGSNPAAPTFGQSSTMSLGAKASPWATASTSAASPSFGSPGFANAGATSGKVFGSGAVAATPAPGAGFAGFAGNSGFASLGSNTNGGSIFAQPSSSGTFGSSNNQAVGQTSFGKPAASDTAFPPPSSKSEQPFGSSPFVLGSTFKADPATANDNEKPGEKSSGSLFGNKFGLSLGDATNKESAKDQEMDITTPRTEQPKSMFSVPQSSTTPTTTPAPSKLFSTSPVTSQTPNPFGTTTKSTQNLFGASSVVTSSTPNPFSQPASAHKPFGSSSSTPKINPFDGKPNPYATQDNKETSQEVTEAPLPPESTNFKKAPTSSGDDAPLPPDFATRPFAVPEDAPLPPDFTLKCKANAETVPPPLPKDESSAPEETPEPKPKSHAAEEAPLPPDFTAERASKQPSAMPEIPSSPEEGELSSEGIDDEEEDEDADGEREEVSEDGTEGSGIDVAKDLSPDSTGAGRNPGITPQSSFGGMGGSTFSVLSRPDVSQPRTSLFGEIGRNAPTFEPPPQKSPLSPRSPSPVRAAVPARMLRTDSSRSVSAPGMASQILGTSRQGQGSGSTFSRSIKTKPAAPQEDPNVTLQRKAHEQRYREESQPLQEDDEYEMIQEHLEKEIEPSKNIGEFTAFNSVTADAHASTVAAQVEALYRDMNGMIQTLGLNARVLSSFIKHHTEEGKYGGRTKDDLANADEWVLCEAEDLNHIIDEELARDLEDGRVHDFEDGWDTCQELMREMPKLRAKQEDLKRILVGHFDPEHAAAARSLPLSAEQSAQQNELRQAQMQMTALLAQAESGLTMLKAKIASAAGAAGKTAAVPTVDAIIKTITKMTSMVEKRSGDVDVLENQMRKMGLGSVASREGSPFMTPSPRKSFQSPDPRKSMASSVGSHGGRVTPQRKKISGFTDADKQTIRAKMQKRQTVLCRLKASLQAIGPKISQLDGTEGNM